MPTVNTGPAGTLPSELPSFVGRRRELGELKDLLAASRLVTLTGVGGVGKTRLALRVAGTVRRAFPDGVWFVDLTQLPDSGLLAREVQAPDTLAYLVMAALGLGQGAGPPLHQLTEYLAGRKALLVLDNCEHLLPACAIVADAALNTCPGLRVLATSREPLAIRGEVLYPVAPLPTPEPGLRPRVADLVRNDAVALFLARAQAVVPDFILTGSNGAEVAELCRRLDGVPLAIELAAARVRTLEPQQILDRLSGRFALLSRGSRNAPVRQRALRACVDWSFTLCGKPERLLWARLSVFAGGFELDAVEGVCTDECLSADDLMDVLTGLIEKSIVDRVVTRDGGQARYRMLETIRDYGQEQLIETGEQAVLRGRHRDWYQQLAARAMAERISPRQTYWIARLTREHPNVRAAVEFCLAEPDQAENALRIVTGLPWLYWWSRGVCSEGLEWLERALAETAAPTVLRARAQLLSGFLAAWTGDPDRAMWRLDEGERLAHRLKDAPGLALAGFVRGTAALLQDNKVSQGIESAERGLAILSALPEPERRQELNLRLQLLLQLGPATALIGDHDRAGRYFQEALEIAEPRRSSIHQTWAMWGLGFVAWQKGDTSTADHRVRECLRLAQQHAVPDPYLVARCVEVLAWIAAGRQRYGQAATLLGAVDRAQTDLGKPITTDRLLTADHGHCDRQTRAALGEAEFTGDFNRGRALPLAAALVYALDERRRSPSSPPGSSTTTLSRRERQVAELVARGLTNKQIAALLVIAQRTAEGHVERILAKLGFTNRTQIATWMAEQPSQTTRGGSGCAICRRPLTTARSWWPVASEPSSRSTTS